MLCYKVHQSALADWKKRNSSATKAQKRDINFKPYFMIYDAGFTIYPMTSAVVYKNGIKKIVTL